MNEIAMQYFVELTEEFMRKNAKDLDPADLDRVAELYEDLTSELSRQLMFDDLYN